MSLSLKNIIQESILFISPIADSLSSPNAFARLLKRLGYEREEAVVSEIVNDLQPFREAIIGLTERFNTEVDNNLSWIDLFSFLKESTLLIGNLEKICNRVSRINIPDSFLPDLLDLLLCNYIYKSHTEIFRFLVAIGMISLEIVPELNNQNSKDIRFLRFELDWTRVRMILVNPAKLMKELYGWGTENFSYQLLLTRLNKLLIELGLDVSTREIAYYFLEDFFPSAINALIPPWSANVILFQDELEEYGLIEFSVSLIPIEGLNENDHGLAIVPSSHGNLSGLFKIDENFSLEIYGLGEIAGGVVIAYRPYSGLDVRSGIGNNSLGGSFKFRVSLIWTPSQQEDIYIFGNKNDTNFTIRNIIFSIYSDFNGSNEDLGIELKIEGARFELAIEQADSFIRDTIANKSITSNLDLKLGVSIVNGFFICANTGLEVIIPLHFSLGAIEIESLFLGLILGDENNKNESIGEFKTGISLNGNLGPISFNVKSIGTKLKIDSPPNKIGNFGPLALDFDFLPPTGVGLAINASGVTGGGFLEFDYDNQRYSGVLALQFSEISLAAIGLITTRMPDGSDGFAMLINIGVVFNPAIQLGMGFSLNGVGGLIGINRSMQVDVLRSGIKNHTLDGILFPEPDSVIANANKIISDLRTVFPAEEGQYVVGPMLKIAWGSTLLTADVGFFIEFPDPIRILLLGQVKAAVPNKSKALILVNLDIIGVIDFAKEELTFQASLYDSRILKFDMFGDAAFLVGWGDDPRFALAIGGFHPKFTPPPPAIVFADLKRLTVSLSSGSGFKLSCQSYLAITSNSFQFGARADLLAKAGPLSVDGYLGFEALFIFSPFYFEVEIYAGMHLKFKSITLLGADLHFWLSGPTPWRAKGTASISLLFFTIDVGFDFEWGSKQQATLPPVDPWEHLKKELENPDNWGAILPSRRSMVAVFRSREEDNENSEEIIVVHPAGTLEVRQKVCPLGIPLQQFNNAPVANYNELDITDIKIDDESLGATPIYEYFGRGQFQALTVDQKLSQPSFEKFKAGVRSSQQQEIKILTEFHSSGEPQPKVEYEILDYESVLYNEDHTTTEQEAPGKAIWEDTKHLVAATTRKNRMKKADPLQKYSRRLHPIGLKVENSNGQHKVVHLQKRPLAKLREEKYYVRLDYIKKNGIGSENVSSETRTKSEIALQEKHDQIWRDRQRVTETLIIPAFESVL